MRLVQPLPNLHSIQTTLRMLVLVLSELGGLDALDLETGEPHKSVIGAAILKM